VRGNFVQRAKENIFGAAGLQTVRDGTGFAIEVTAAGFIVRGQQAEIVQQSGQLLFDAFPKAGAEVGGDGQPEIGRQQILDNKPQPAEVMAFGPRLVKQQMRAGVHGAAWF
jgi:hypothetical protein